MTTTVKTEFISWGEFLPDRGYFAASSQEGPALVRGTENLLAAHGNYIVGRDVESLDTGEISSLSTLVSQCVAAPLGPTADTWRLIAGDDTNLWRYDPATPAVTDVTKLATLYNGNEWFFAVYGDSVVATNGVDAVQLLTASTLSAGGNAVDCFTGSGTSTPLAKYVSTYRQHLVIGHYKDGSTWVPHGVWVGATDDLTIMGTVSSHRSLNTTKQPLYDSLGAVTGIAEGVDYALIAREKGWTRMDGPPYGFFTIDPNGGTVYSRSLVMVGGECYFIGGGSVKKIGREGPAVDLGQGRVARYLFDPEFNPVSTLDLASVASQEARLSVSGAYDPHSNTILWQWSILGIGYGLAYNIAADRFSYLRMTDSDPDDLRRGWGGVSAMPPRADQAWYPLQNLVFILSRGGSTNAQYFAQFTNTRLFTAAASTGYFSHTKDEQQLKSRYVSLRPVYALADGASKPTITVTTYSTSVPYGAADTVTTWTEGDGGRFYPSEEHHFEEFHRIVIRWGTESAGTEVSITEFKGMELEVELAESR